METAEVCYDERGILPSGAMGLWRVKLVKDPGVMGTGSTEKKAIDAFLMVAGCFGYSNRKGDYQFERAA